MCLLPLGLANSFGEDVVPASVAHHSILQVKLPAVLAAVDLQRQKEVRPSAGERRPSTLPLGGRRPYFVVLANDDIVGVKEIWDVLLHHVVA